MPANSASKLPAKGRGARDGSRERILAAALAMIVDRGAGGVTLADVVAEAGVSRATLYRHFSGWQEILEGVFERTVRMTLADLSDAIAADPDPARRLDVVFGWLGAMLESGLIARLLETDPAFILELVRRVNAQSWPIFDEALAPVYDQAERVFGVRADRALVTEIITRLHVSIGLFPGERIAANPGAVLKATFQALLLASAMPIRDVP